jgi:DNA-binding NarL/FixJ family response regulator
MPLTLLLADDHQIVRQGLRAILNNVADFRLVGEAADGPEAVRLAERLEPDVLLLDLMLPGLNGLEVARHLTRRPSRTRILILSMHANEAYVFEALRAGATGYVVKDSSADELVQAIRKTAQGVRYLSRSISETALSAYIEMAEGEPLDPIKTLTFREREVLQMTVEGHSAAEIAQRLFISRRTVETHRANMMRKLGVRNQRELTRCAVQNGILLDKGKGASLTGEPTQGE